MTNRKKLCWRCNKKPIPSGRRKHCNECAEIIANKGIKKSNARASARRNEGKPPKLCACGCGVQVHGCRVWAPECKSGALVQQRKAAKNRAKVLYEKRKAGEAPPLSCGAIKDPATVIAKPKPRKIMSASERNRLDAEQYEYDRRERLREIEALTAKGYGHGPVKIYRGEEAQSIPVIHSYLLPKHNFGAREAGVVSW